MSEAETLLKKIRKLEVNMNCPNCDSRAQQGIGKIFPAKIPNDYYVALIDYRIRKCLCQI